MTEEAKPEVYLLFSGFDYDHGGGGWEYFIGEFCFLSDAVQRGLCLKNTDWFHVVDLARGKIALEYYREPTPSGHEGPHWKRKAPDGA